MNKLTDFCFKGCPNSKLIVSVNSMEARWCHKPEKIHGKDEIPFDKQLVKECISYLLDNCYFTVGKFLNKLLVYPWVLTLRLLWQICFYTIMKVILSRSVGERKIKLFISLVIFSVLQMILMQLLIVGNSKRTLKTYTPKSWNSKEENIGYTEATFLDLEIN